MGLEQLFGAWGNLSGEKTAAEVVAKAPQIFTLGKFEFYFLIFGLVMAIFLAFILIVIAAKTPAFTFFKAMIRNKPIVHLKSRDQRGRFIIGRKETSDSMSVKDYGIIGITENSHTLEIKSKTPVYEVFAEHAMTVPHDYPAIIQELKKLLQQHKIDYKITNFDDLKTLVKLSQENYKDYVDSILVNVKKDKEKEKIREKFKSIAEQLKDIKIDIQPMKTYKVYELANMFPFNIHPSFIESRVQHFLAIQAKKMQQLAKIVPWVAIILVTGAVAVYIVSKIQTPACPEVVCRCGEIAKGAIEAVTNTIA